MADPGSQATDGSKPIRMLCLLQQRHMNLIWTTDEVGEQIGKAVNDENIDKNAENNNARKSITKG